MLRAVSLLLLIVAPLAAVAPRGTHWSFLPPVRSPVPAVRSDRARTPIDRFVLARLEARGWSLAPEADRITLIRRLTFDLLGLPPTPEDVDAFVNDKRPDAYERLVDRLLASPHFGERWAQHWLDVARYAETNGYEADGERPQAWRYRDWVVKALNADLPYDRFITAQVAGDLLKGDPDGRIAAGFNRCGPIHQVGGNVDPKEIRHELLNEMTGGVGSAFLGLTLSCARCHDHKFDPISQKEYFQIEAFFSVAKPVEVNLAGPIELATHARDVAAHQAKLAPLRAAVSAIDAPYRQRIHAEKMRRLEPKYREALAVDAKKRTPEQKKLAADAGPLVKVSWDEVLEALTPADRERRVDIRAKMHAIEAHAPAPPPRAWTLEEGKGPLTTHLLKRGSINRPGPKVVPAYPAVLPAAAAKDRTDLAKWLTMPRHPLTARVMVNRLWQHHFGAGIVRTPNDFGTRGDPPTHPELLDWLAVELVESGWSLKHVHRLILLSSAYRQARKATNPEAKLRDPDNRLLWRMNRRRLEGEALRDAVLATSGRLTPWVGGAMVRTPLEPEVYDLIFTEGEPDGLWLPHPDDRQHTRRTLYLFNKRNVRLPLLEAFDQPDTLTSCPVRSVSTFAPQSLILLNGPLLQGESRAMATRLWSEAGPAAGPQIERAYRLALGRAPSETEKALAAAFLDEQSAFLRDELRARRPVALPDGPDGASPARLAALADFCLALLNRNAFVHVE